ncbi:hypothetical protein Q0M94_24085 (plasmid) [Deinococcus radiomollis]|uniref:hypothetical protein n=1 Tax=Deinococcus radiomollis TaxID=468916 RepID=UPI003892A2E3
MPDRITTTPDTVPKAIWAYLMENAQTVVVTLTIVMLIVVIVPPMVASQRAAHDTVAQSCARALQSALTRGENGQDLRTLLKLDEVQTACAAPTLHIIPLAQPGTFAVQNTSGTHTYVVTPSSVTRTP